MIWWINHQWFFIVAIIQLVAVRRAPGATSNASSFLPLFSCCGDKNTTIPQNSCLSARSCCHGNRSLVAICLTISFFLLRSLFILWLSSCLIPPLMLSSIVLSLPCINIKTILDLCLVLITQLSTQRKRWAIKWREDSAVVNLSSRADLSQAHCAKFWTR